MDLEDYLRSQPTGRFLLTTTGVDPRWMRIRIQVENSEESEDWYVFGDRLISTKDFQAFTLIGDLQ